MVDINPIGALSFRTAALMICITCIFYTAVMKRETKKRLRSRLFLAAIIITLYDCATGIFNTLVMDSDLSSRTKYLVVYFSKLTYYGTHFAFVPVFSLYIILVCNVFHRYRNRLKLAVIFAPCLLLEAAVITNPLTNLIIVSDGNYNITRGNGVYLAYIVGALYLGFCFYLLRRYWYTMNHLQKIAMFYFLGLAVTGVVIQMIFPEIICELLAEALGLMGIMIMIEKDDYRLDYKTQAYNRSALIQDLKSSINVEKTFYVICVRVESVDLYRRLMGNEGYDNILISVAQFLKDIDYRYDVYRTTGGNYYMLCEDMCSLNVDEVIGRIVKRFDKSFEVGDSSTNIKARIICVKCPDEFKDAYDILRLSESNIDAVDKTVLKGHDLDFLLRNIDVEKAIIRGFAGDAFRVVYHPVYLKKTMGVFSADALLTLNDPVIGRIGFDEFKTVAENTGMAGELEFRMIEAVCRFISSGVKNSDMDIAVFTINIMSVQVLTQELVDKVGACLEKYSIDPGMLRLSVSDTIAKQAQDVLGYIIDEFIKIGIRFILFNHDSAFLGLDVTTIDKFDGINVDVKRHFDLVDIVQGEAILRNKVNMVSQLGKKVILSGIDSRDLYDRIKDVNADFVIGDYLSPVVTGNELQNKFWNKEVFNEKST